MGKTIVVLPIIICIFALAVSISEALPPTYWISFRSHTDAVELIKINAFGQVLQPSLVVVGRPAIKGRTTVGTTLSNSQGGQLVMWLSTLAYRETTGIIYQARINKGSFHLVSLHNTHLKSANAFPLQVTQKSEGNFLVTTRKTQSLDIVTANVLLPNAKPSGTHYRIASQPVADFGCPACGAAGVSSDGLLAWMHESTASYKDKTFLQRLGPEGRRNGKPFLVTPARGFPAAYIGTDLSSVLSSGVRFLIYISVDPNNEASTRLVLQKIDDRTGANIGPPILIAQEYYIFSSAIDPAGKFVIYTMQFKDGSSIRGLKFQALDATGHPSGSSKFLTRKAEAAIDMLQEQ